MHSRIGPFHALLLEGTLNKDNIEAIINKSMDLFKKKQGFMQCCSVEGIPSIKFALNAMENALGGKRIGKAKPKKSSLGFLLWLYCTSQLDRAIGQGGKREKGMLLAIASKERSDLKKGLELAQQFGFRSEKGIIEKNFKKNLNVFIEKFQVSRNELKAFSHLPKQEAVERLIIERQALLGL